MKRTELKRKKPMRRKTVSKKRRVEREQSTARMKKRCDALFAAIVRAPGECIRCGSRENLQCAHIRSRRYNATRWSFDNAVCLCATCHYFFTVNPLRWEEWVVERFGARRWNALRKKALAGKALRPVEYRELQANLSSMLADLDPESRLLVPRARTSG